MNNRRILWIEDDYYHLKYLAYMLEAVGYEIDVAKSATEGYEKAINWREYDAIVVDLILISVSGNKAKTLPSEVLSWKKEEYLGVGLVKWLLRETQLEIPVFVVSVVNDPADRYHIDKLDNSLIMPKDGLKPSIFRDKILGALGNKYLQEA